MKKLTTILLCCLPVLLASCLKEDMSDCPPAVNLQLTFSYTGDTNDASMFARCIDHVALMVYDENGKQVLNRGFNKNDLIRHQGADVYLHPGSYRIICWGNTHEYTQITGSELFAGSRLHHHSLTTGGDIATNSHLYYASYPIVVPNQGTVQGDIPFRGAHINVEMYIRDLAAENAALNTPQIKAHNLMPQYDMEMEAAMAYSTTYYPECSYNPEKVLNEALFQVLNFRDDNPVIVEVENESGETNHRIDLKKYMADNNISVDGKNEATIAILIEFTDLGVVVKLPEWIVNEVEPGTR